MKCSKCSLTLKTIQVKLFGEEFKAKECPGCKKQIIGLDIAMKLHDRLSPKVKCEKKVIKVGDSSAITIPKEIKHFFTPGSIVSMNFDPQEMEIKIKKRQVAA